ncbi:hypothetical protein B0A55_07498 [Friedmanniomyces simplex]|uniref:Uncharacterized protein n=1 Tax=Friedmanniomyces simplex TaxID=329884 RepID=A0A4U0XAD9_9PEZI|nr:hypothetical protein B0A55_07498 [Friedmanniomyces simplex]
MCKAQSTFLPPAAVVKQKGYTELLHLTFIMSERAARTFVNLTTGDMRPEELLQNLAADMPLPTPNNTSYGGDMSTPNPNDVFAPTRPMSVKCDQNG